MPCEGVCVHILTSLASILCIIDYNDLSVGTRWNQPCSELGKWFAIGVWQMFSLLCCVRRLCAEREILFAHASVSLFQAQRQSMEMSSKENEEYYASVRDEKYSQLQASVCSVLPCTFPAAIFLHLCVRM